MIVEKSLSLLQRVCIAIGGTCLIGSLALVVIDIVGRLIGFRVGFSGQVQTLCVVFSALVLFGSVSRRDEHARIAYVSQLIFRRRAKPLYLFLENVCALLLLGYFMWAGSQLIASHVATGFLVVLWPSGPGGNDIAYGAWINIVLMEVCLFTAWVFYAERLWKQILGVLHGRRTPQLGVGDGEKRQGESHGMAR